MVLRTAAYRPAASAIKYKDLILKNNITMHLRRTLAALAGIILLTAPKTHAADPEYLITDNLAVSIKDGCFSALLAYREGRDYLPQGQPAPPFFFRKMTQPKPRFFRKTQPTPTMESLFLSYKMEIRTFPSGRSGRIMGSINP